MSASSQTQTGLPTVDRPAGSERWFRALIAAILILLGVMIAIASVASAIWGTAVPWTWIGALTGVLIGMLIVALVLRRTVWSSSEFHHEGRRARRERRRSGYESAPAHDSAVDEARRRYARGDISQAQYQQILHDLNEPSST
jgi:uncharacterized membrane protein